MEHDSPISRRKFLRQAGIAASAGLAASTPLLFSANRAFGGVPQINFAYILSDHHAPLMLLAGEWERFRESCGTYIKPVRSRTLYDMHVNGARVARIKLIPTKKGPDVQKLVANGDVDAGISGTQAILLSVDRGAGVKLISPLQKAGNVFVVQKDLPVQGFHDFLNLVRDTKQGMKVGMPGPHCVATIIFRSALDRAGVTYTESSADSGADVQLINMKGHSNLTTALSNGMAEAVIGAQPYPAIAVERGEGRMAANLQDLPATVDWRGHACCSLEATTEFLQREPDLARSLMEMMVRAARSTAERPDLAAKACSGWLGDSLAVEKRAMPTLAYGTEPTQGWRQSVRSFIQSMREMGMFKGTLSEDAGGDPESRVYDFTLVNDVREQLELTSA